MRSILVGLVILATSIGCGGSGADAKRTVTVSKRSPPSHKLAALDAGSQEIEVSKVKPYEDTLAALAKKCPHDNQGRLADLAVTGQETMKGSTLLELLKSADDAIPMDEYPGESCAEVFAAIVTLAK